MSSTRASPAVGTALRPCAVYEIEVRSPAHVCKGVKALYLDGVRVERLPLLAPGTTGRVTAVLG